MQIYDNVKKICREKGIPIAVMERKLGFARSSISKWNENEPGVRKIQSVADFLGVPIESLLMETGEGEIS